MSLLRLHVGQLGLGPNENSDLPLSQDIIASNPEMRGCMFVPIILGTDKTTVSVATGQNEYYPVYLSIGNIHNNVRRAHKDALVLIGFLPIPKGSNYILLMGNAHVEL